MHLKITKKTVTSRTDEVTVSFTYRNNQQTPDDPKDLEAVKKLTIKLFHDAIIADNE